MARAALSLGSNLEPRREYLKLGIARLKELARVVAVSSVYETEPQDLKAQPDFLNMAVLLETGLAPEILLQRLRVIEQEAHRKNEPGPGPRTLDIDLLFFENQVRKGPELMLPHPRLHQRAFVLEPLNEIAPDLLHPVLGLTMTQLLKELDLTGQKIRNLGRLEGI
jgi:2-amino-4-hydroxy-6-hydroxymethyldihydropteridine diphosphokinase